MTLPQPDSGKRADAGKANAGPPASASQKPGGRAIFDQILDQTSSLLSRETLSAADRTAMEEVARRMLGKPLEAVAAELLFAILKNHIPGLPGFGELAPALSQRVARTLLDNPAAKARLEILWNRLQGAAP